MKTLNITFTDTEFRRLVKAKKSLEEEQNTYFTWHKFILTKCCRGISIFRKGNKK